MSLTAAFQLIELNSEWTSLVMQGPDSAKFMQGQLTCNTATLDETQARFGGHCTPKGRLQANFYLSKFAQDSFLFVLPQASSPALLKSLSKYIVFSKAKLRDAASEYQLFGLLGDGAFAALNGVLPALLNERLAAASNEQITVICVEPNRFIIAVKQADAEQLTSQWLDQGAHKASINAWQLADINAGFGFVAENTIDEFIPQMLNMQLIDGISFNKGCYTGQEIVARMQYRGTLKKAMYLVSGQGALPANNAEIHDSERLVGNTVSSVATDTGWLGLAVINHNAIAENLNLAGQPIRVAAEQPYSVAANE